MEQAIAAPRPAPAVPDDAWHRAILSMEQVLIVVVEIPAALLVLAEIAILFLGVVMRYFVHEPIVWSDELASVLFIWLAMLGSVVAFQRGEHMRMTALVSRVSPERRAILETFAITRWVATIRPLSSLHNPLTR